MKLITYTYNKSTSVGGIEVLTRNLQNVALDKGAVVEELYHGISGEEVVAQNSEVNYVRLFERFDNFKLNPKLFLYVIRKINTYNFLSKNYSLNSDTLVIYHPAVLNFIPKKVINQNKVILVQTNRFDIFFNVTGNFAFKRNIKSINYLTVYTDADKVKLIELYPQFNLQNKIKVIPRACRLPTTNKKQTLSKKLITIARIEEHSKNFTAMVKIIKLLPESYTLDIYGTGTSDEVDRLQLLIKNEPRINFCGVARNVDKILKQYSLFIMTSYYEGFGQTLIEARSQGLPLVAFGTFDALPFIIEDGFNGRIVEAFDCNSFAKAITDTLSSDQSYDKYSENAILKSKETEQKYVSRLWEALL